MKKIQFISIALLATAIFAFSSGCQKEQVAPTGERQFLSVGPCIVNAWTETKITTDAFLKEKKGSLVPYTGDVYLDVWNDGAYVYLKVYRSVANKKISSLDIASPSHPTLSASLTFSPSVNSYQYQIFNIWETICEDITFNITVGGIPNKTGTVTTTLTYTVKHLAPPPPLTVTDFDGNIYNTVSIPVTVNGSPGTQVWLKENLKVTKFNDGTAIGDGSNASTWQNADQGGIPLYSWYNNDASNKATYGALYNGYVVTNTKNVCPTGWHVPTQAEMDILVNSYGGGYYATAGVDLKEAGNDHWETFTPAYGDPNPTGLNTSGFTALPGGMHDWNGTYVGIELEGTFYTSTPSPAPGYTWTNAMYYNILTVVNSGKYNTLGYSVRCIQD